MPAKTRFAGMARSYKNTAHLNKPFKLFWS